MIPRSTIGGLLLIGAGCIGSFLLWISYSLPLTVLIGLLLLTLPASLYLWYLAVRLDQIEATTRDSARQVRRAVEVHATTMGHRFDSTIQQIEEQNDQFRQRIYR